MLLCLVKVVLGGFILMYLGINLVGMVVRGFVTPVDLRDVQTDALWLVDEAKKAERADRMVTLASVVVTVLYLYALVHFWNVWVAVAGIMFMVSRFPDLLWELRTGRKVGKDNMPPYPLSRLTLLLDLGAFPLLWFAICRS